MSEFVDRMKALEAPTKIILPARTNTVVRLDGRAFRSYTASPEKPFDMRFVAAMNAAANVLCEQVPSAVCAFVQSDEISLIFTDYMGTNTQPWFGGSLQKITSVTSSIVTYAFNEGMAQMHPEHKRQGVFDARVFTVNSREDLVDYLSWRQADCERNAISMIAETLYSHSELQGANLMDRVNLISDKGVLLTSYPSGCLHGRFFAPETQVGDVEYTHSKTGENRVIKDVERRVWLGRVAPDFRTHPEALLDLLPAAPVLSPA